MCHYGDRTILFFLDSEWAAIYNTNQQKFWWLLLIFPQSFQWICALLQSLYHQHKIWISSQELQRCIGLQRTGARTELWGKLLFSFFYLLIGWPIITCKVLSMLFNSWKKFWWGKLVGTCTADPLSSLHHNGSHYADVLRHIWNPENTIFTSTTRSKSCLFYKEFVNSVTGSVQD